MSKRYTILRWFSVLVTTVMLVNCGGGGSTSSTATTNNTQTSINTEDNNINTETNTDNEEDDFSRSQYRGLGFYYKNMPSSDYSLTQLTDANYNHLSETQKLQVADKLLSTLFFGYPLKVIEEKIASGNFIENIRSGLAVDKTDKEWLENYIIDDDIF
ncbi:MAG: hypothetical protein DRG09_02820, partial [Epsilonproteobacteria bacterium]